MVASLGEALALSNDARVITLANAQIVHTNRGWAELTGYKFTEVVNHTSSFLQGPATESDAAEQLKQACAAGVHAKVQLVNYTKDGRPFVNTLECFPLKDGAGELTHFCGVLTGEPATALAPLDRSVTAAPLLGKAPAPPPCPVAAEGAGGAPAAGKRKFVRLSEALGNCSDAVVLTQPHPPYAITHVNGPWVEMCGYSAEEVEGLTNGVLQGPETDAKLLDELMSSVRRSEPAAASLVNYKKGGERFLNHLRVYPVVADDDERKVEQFMALLSEEEAPPAL